MKILLIYPRYQWTEHGQMQEPLGILYIASVLKKAGHEVRLLDFTVEKNLDKLADQINWAEAAGMTVSSVLFNRALLILNKIKEIKPGIPVIAGGPHPTADTEGTLKAGFDFAVVGEGEQTALQLFSALEQGRDSTGIPGAWAIKDGKIFPAPARELIPDISTLPMPDRALIDYKTYLHSGMIQVGVCLSRGCPFSCKFCKPMQDMLFGKKLRKRNPESVVEEIEQAIALTGHDFFLFRDDCLTALKMEWFEKFRAEMDRRKLKIRFSGQTRVSDLDEETLLVLKSLGLQGLAFGVESGSQKVVDYYRKSFKVEQSLTAFELCHKHQIGTHCFIMLGAPDETKEDVQMTIDLVKKIRPESVTISRLTPAPGTYLHSECIEQGILKDLDWEEWDFYKNQSPLKLRHLTEADLMKAEDEIRRIVPGSIFYPKQSICPCS
jgi:anaerobic magnesium-protoporphyrin IX monomethyl ester cyclase